MMVYGYVRIRRAVLASAPVIAVRGGPMKKFFLIVLFVVIGIPASILIAGSMQPAAYHVERSALVPAPPDAVYAVISDFHRFAEWSPWEKLDPAMEKTFGG